MYIAFKALMCLLFFALSFSSPARAESGDILRARVMKAASRLEPVTGQNPRVIIREDASQSAFVLPNGAVVISRGLLASTSSEDEVAFVIAHEVSHIIARDQDRMGSTAELMGFSDPTNLQLGEIKADASAVAFMKKAGYDPGASIGILKRLSSKGVNLSPRISAISSMLAR